MDDSVSFFYLYFLLNGTQLFQYMEHIIFTWKKIGGFNWRVYDIDFRMQQSANPSRSWATINGVLWLQEFTSSGLNNLSFRTPLCIMWRSLNVEANGEEHTKMKINKAHNSQASVHLSLAPSPINYQSRVNLL